MPVATVELRSIDDTEAALGWAGGHTVVVDRPEGRAGGQGLGFNGAQLLGLSAGGCFCNDLRYAAHELGVRLAGISVSVEVALDGSPLLVTGIAMTVRCETADGSDPAIVIAKAKTICTVANSLRQGVPVEIGT